MRQQADMMVLTMYLPRWSRKILNLLPYKDFKYYYRGKIRVYLLPYHFLSWWSFIKETVLLKLKIDSKIHFRVILVSLNEGILFFVINNHPDELTDECELEYTAPMYAFWALYNESKNFFGKVTKSGPTRREAFNILFNALAEKHLGTEDFDHSLLCGKLREKIGDEVEEILGKFIIT